MAFLVQPRAHLVGQAVIDGIDQRRKASAVGRRSTSAASQRTR